MNRKTERESKRVRAESTGRFAEGLAALFLAAKGYRILARRFEAPGGEIDLVAWTKGVLVFVEVKARANLDDAVFAVTGRNRRRIEAAARSYVSRHPRRAEDGVRFDIIAISGWRLKHLRDAWREGERD